MELIGIDSLFPEEPSRPGQPSGQTAPPSPSSSQDMELVKRNMVTTNALYNLLLSKGIVTRDEYHVMKQNIHRIMFPEDFE